MLLRIHKQGSKLSLNFGQPQKPGGGNPWLRESLVALILSAAVAGISLPGALVLFIGFLIFLIKA